LETIIHQTLVGMSGEIVETALGCNLNLEKAIPKIMKSIFRYAVDILQQLIEATDKSLLEDKAGRRKEGWVVERRGDKRAVMTQIGELQYKRVYYENIRTGTYGYPIDQIIGVVPYQHVGTGLSKDLVSQSRRQSYHRTVERCCSGSISRQTVLNKIRRAEAVIDKPSGTARVPELHIDADEDHVAMQGSRCRSRTTVPLVSVYEGIEGNGTRNRCRNVFHISAYGKKPDALWEEVLTRMEQRYDLANTKIYLHGDGAEWIARGLEWLPNASFVLDKYHKNKYVFQLLAGYDAGRVRQLRRDLDQSLYDMDGEYFENIVQMLLYEMPQRAEEITEAANYLRIHMPAIAVQRTDPSAGNGGATEPHVSHVLSSRLSSRPMGWSKKTLQRFVPILANGPEVTFEQEEQAPCTSMAAVKAFQTTRRSALAARALAKQPSSLPVIQFGKRTEIYKLLHSMEYSPTN
jgi:hypothetical protein